MYVCIIYIRFHLECIQEGFKGNCNFYRCASKHFGCKDSDYFINYGHLYCMRFHKYSSSFNEKVSRQLKAKKTSFIYVRL